MIIEEMRHKDLEQVTALAAQLGYLFSMNEIKSRFKNISKLSSHKLYVARDSEKILGWIQVNKEPASLLSDKRVEVSALVVDEHYRGQGIGKTLLASAEDWAKSQSLLLVRIRSNVMRETAHQFYIKQGYSLKKTSHLLMKFLK